jgi:hypothetical protein
VARPIVAIITQQQTVTTGTDESSDSSLRKSETETWFQVKKMRQKAGDSNHFLKLASVSPKGSTDKLSQLFSE